MQLSPQSLLKLLDQQRFGVEYQPIVDIKENNIFGYEALARFYDETGQSISPQQVFAALHDSPLCLFQTEFKMKQLQLQHAPDKGLLFVNLDQDSFAAFGDLGDANPMVQLLTSKSNLVLEVIENTDISDAGISQAMTKTFGEKGVLLALDDIGAPDSMLSLPVLMNMDFLKFDRSWLALLDDPNHELMLQGLTTYGRRTGKKTILEGIETLQDLEIAKQMGFDFVQGFLFREAFINVIKPIASELNCSLAA
jgi:EAL domain-containing protein (putative c-di-GMP-specific phosphodiesterase class I)